MFYRLSIVAFVLLLNPALCLAQDAHRNVWKKRVKREVRVNDNMRRPRQYLVDGVDTPLIATIAEALRSGTLKAYSEADFSLSVEKTKKELLWSLRRRIDTIMVLDPVDGKEVVKIVYRRTDYENTYRYYILEDWVFDPESLETSIQVLAVAPILDEYDDNGEYRGGTTMFWIKYPNVSAILNHYVKGHPGNDVSAGIWKSYFSNVDTNMWSADRSGGRSGRAIRTFSMEEKGGSEIPHIYIGDQNYGVDTPFAIMIADQIRYGKISAFEVSDVKMTKPLTTNEFNKLLKSETDKITCDHCEDGYITYKTVFQDIPIYNVLEDWQLNPATGRTDVKVIAIAPVAKQYANVDTTYIPYPYFWVKYRDVKSTIESYGVYHPESTFPLNLWSNYFLLGEKPKLLKK